MAATIAALADGLRELLYKEVNNTYALSTGGPESGGQQYAEDTVHVSGDLGNVSLAVRKDGGGSTAGTDGDYATLTLDSTGRLWVHIGAIDVGSTVIGKVGIDQTTPGTTNAVAIGSALPAGTALIGKVGIDQTTPGSTNGTQQKQYSGVPSTFTVGTSDATVFTLAAGEIGFIQNLDDAALAVKKGASASTTSFSLILNAGTAADDGKGGAILIDDWIGVVSVAAMAGSPRYIAWKQAA